MRGWVSTTQLATSCHISEKDDLSEQPREPDTDLYPSVDTRGSGHNESSQCLGLNALVVKRY